MNNCVRPCDTDDRAIMMTFRRACPDASILKPISDGESLRNFDTMILEKVRKFLEPSLESRPLPYIRNFQLKIGNEKKKETKDRKRTQKEQLSFLFKKSKTKKKSPERPVKTKDDEYWKFGVSQVCLSLGSLLLRVFRRLLKSLRLNGARMKKSISEQEKSGPSEKKPVSH